ncbi:hypothetical protein SAMN04488029_1526 [Reichenbachiella faecimaris]|uniref:Uncharacterized protein n=1 Tax=Reichenbachiella faecimaris TaxID=692418 RepID=A0A1W2G994_REIFA|nr:hypothetical protein [Reichenbachiella faecimaris]SMD33161.1 hypothetical protein SAMN04488029_1526 [Reichenbachiella faecimaris]
MSQTENTLHVAVYLNVENIVSKYPNPNGEMIDLVNGAETFFQFLPTNSEGYIEVPTTTKQITFTLSDSKGHSDGRYWLTRFINEDEGIIAPSTPNKGGALVPANILTVDVNPDVKKGDTEDFKLHCYFIYFDESTGENLVYHCKTDPKLQADQPGGGG